MSSNPYYSQPQPEYYKSTIERDTSAAEQSFREAIEAYPSGVYIPERGNVSYNPDTKEFALSGHIIGKPDDKTLINILQKSISDGPSGISPPPGFQSVDEGRYLSILNQRQESSTDSLSAFPDTTVSQTVSTIVGFLILGLILVFVVTKYLNAYSLHLFFGFIQICLFSYGIYAIFAISLWLGIGIIVAALVFGFIGTIITTHLLSKSIQRRK